MTVDFQELIASGQSAILCSCATRSDQAHHYRTNLVAGANSAAPPSSVEVHLVQHDAKFFSSRAVKFDRLRPRVWFLLYLDDQSIGSLGSQAWQTSREDIGEVHVKARNDFFVSILLVEVVTLRAVEKLPQQLQRSLSVLLVQRHPWIELL